MRAAALFSSVLPASLALIFPGAALAMLEKPWMPIVAALFLAPMSPVVGQQVADPEFDTSVATPAFPTGRGPTVLVDAGHHNFHTLEGRYASFGATLDADGYRVRSVSARFSRAALDGADVLVIANAGTDAESSWSLPTPSAFTEEEIAAVHAWVADGGALFLIADHMPAAGAAADLAEAFGVRFTNGYTIGGNREHANLDVFTRADSTLLPHPIMEGRNARERVNSVVTFTGQAFQAGVPARPLLRFGPEAVTMLPVHAGRGFTDETPRVRSGGWLHAVTVTVGRGRVAMFGEAAMFSAQLAGRNRSPMGMNHPLATHNKQLLLNTVRWLSGLIG